MDEVYLYAGESNPYDLTLTDPMSAADEGEEEEQPHLRMLMGMGM